MSLRTRLDVPPAAQQPPPKLLAPDVESGRDRHDGFREEADSGQRVFAALRPYSGCDNEKIKMSATTARAKVKLLSSLKKVIRHPVVGNSGSSKWSSLLPTV